MQQKTKLTIYSCLAVPILLFAVNTTARAGMITLGAADIIDPPGASQTNPNPSEATILTYLNLSDHVEYQNVTDLGDLLYKDNVGGSEEGLLAGSYEISNLSGAGGTLKYISGNIFDSSLPIWMVIKDGNAGFVIYDLASTGPHGVSWDGLMDIVFTNAGLIRTGTTTVKDISNVQIWGSSTTPPDPDPGPGVVPEPSSMLLMAMGMFGLAGYGWRKRKSQAA